MAITVDELREKLMGVHGAARVVVWRGAEYDVDPEFTGTVPTADGVIEFWIDVDEPG